MGDKCCWDWGRRMWLRWYRFSIFYWQSIYILSINTSTTLPTTISPVCGWYLFLIALTIMSLLVISTVPKSELYILFSTLYVPWPLVLESKCTSCIPTREWLDHRGWRCWEGLDRWCNEKCLSFGWFCPGWKSTLSWVYWRRIYLLLYCCNYNFVMSELFIYLQKYIK